MIFFLVPYYFLFEVLIIYSRIDSPKSRVVWLSGRTSDSIGWSVVGSKHAGIELRTVAR